jgi:hypothetical protein
MLFFYALMTIGFAMLTKIPQNYTALYSSRAEWSRGQNGSFWNTVVRGYL